jgi:hypothetical protein
MVVWCETAGKGTPYLGDPKYPIGICIGRELSGWVERMDRALDYISFKDFIASI